MSKVTMIFSRETDLAPTLWMVAPKERVKYLGRPMEKEEMRELWKQAGVKKVEEITEESLEYWVKGPENLEVPLKLVEISEEELAPMGLEELREVLDRIEEENEGLAAPSPEWDETPVEREEPR